MLEYVKESLSHLLCDLVLMIPIKSIIINILYWDSKENQTTWHIYLWWFELGHKHKVYRVSQKKTLVSVQRLLEALKSELWTKVGWVLKNSGNFKSAQKLCIFTQKCLRYQGSKLATLPKNAEPNLNSWNTGCILTIYIRNWRVTALFWNSWGSFGHLCDPKTWRKLLLSQK